MAQEITPETLPEMEAALPTAVGLLPSAFPMDVIGYACTPGATIIGADNISRIVTRTFPSAKTTDPITAAMAALQHLGMRKTGLVTPYVEDVSAAMIDLLQRNGFEVVNFGSFEQKEDATVARITPDSIYNAVCDIGALDDVEAVFVSCTNLRTFDVIERAERNIGKPVVSSNQALAWHMAELAELKGSINGPGEACSLSGKVRKHHRLNLDVHHATAPSFDVTIPTTSATIARVVAAAKIAGLTSFLMRATSATDFLSIKQGTTFRKQVHLGCFSAKANFFPPKVVDNAGQFGDHTFFAARGFEMHLGNFAQQLRNLDFASVNGRAFHDSQILGPHPNIYL